MIQIISYKNLEFRYSVIKSNTHLVLLPTLKGLGVTNSFFVGRGGGGGERKKKKKQRKINNLKSCYLP